MDTNCILIGLNYKFYPSYRIPIHKKCALDFEFFYKEFSYVNPEGKVDNDIIDVDSNILTAKSCVYKFSVKYDDIIYEWVQKSQNTISNLKKTLLRKILESTKIEIRYGNFDIVFGEAKVE